MTRPRKCCRVASMPGVSYFKPAGIPLRFLEEVCLTVEEMEAVRLRDIEDLDQAECAGQMNVSRTTYQRVLESARKKIADALISGKAIKIEGGHFEMACRQSAAGEEEKSDSYVKCRFEEHLKDMTKEGGGQATKEQS